MVANKEQQSGPTIVERWLTEQQQWQRTLLTYLDSMTKDDEFLVHLGNAMRGSLLAGKPYPTQPMPGAAPTEAPPDDRLDRALFTLHQLQGQMHDVLMSLDELRAAVGLPPAKTTARRAAGLSKPRRANGSMVTTRNAKASKATKRKAPRQ